VNAPTRPAGETAPSPPPVHPLAERTIGRILRAKADRVGTRPFLHWRGRTFSYADVDELTSRYACGFAGIGVARGDTVAVMLPNCPEFLWVIWGLGKLGAVAVPLNTSAKGDQLAYYLQQSGSTWLCADQQWLDRLDRPLAAAPAVRGLVLRAPGGKVPEGYADLPVHALADFEQVEPDAIELPDDIGPGDPHLIMYTSGTTGPSKGAISPHSQGHAVGWQMATFTEYRPDDVLYTCLPLFHGNALWYTVYAALWAEASVALYPRFSARSFWQEIRESGATVFNALGAMANIIWQLPAGPADREHRVRSCMLVPTSAALVDGFAERYGITVTSVYAMTENFAITVYGPHDARDKAASAGRVRPYVSVQITDDDGRALPPGEVGEICIRPNEPGMVMLGYHAMPEATIEATRDLWFRTGDRGHLDEEGYLFFSDRKKEAIRRRGENISAYELETILCRHPAVQEAAAVPVPSELSEDDVMVYIVRAEGADPDYAELVAYSVESMAYFMVPRYWKFVDELPKTASQKVEKYKLKVAAVESLDQLWDRERAGIRVVRD
jgi:crotonobetaine/carnitine-CoA ligase